MRFTERLALLDIVGREFDREVHRRAGADADDQPLLRQLVHELEEALAFLRAEQVGGRHLDVVEEQLRRVLRLEAELLQVATAAEALGLGGFDDDQRDAARLLLRVGLGDDDDQIGVLAVGDEGFLAVDDILVAGHPRGRAYGLEVGAGARLGHGDGADQFAGRHLGQPAAFLLLRAIGQDIVGDDAAVHGIAEAADIGPALFVEDDRSRGRKLPPAPPYSSGTLASRRPASPALFHISRGMIPAFAHSSSCGTNSRSKKRPAESCSIDSSSVIQGET